MSIKLAYLSHGRLFYRDGERCQLIESQYGQDVIKRSLARQAKNEWKTGGDSAAALYSRQSLWGASQDDASTVKIKVTGMTKGPAGGDLLYFVATESVGGLFKYHLESDKEIRLFHKESLALSDLAPEPGGESIACSQFFPNGTVSVAVIKGNDVQQLTEGDSIDEAPTWVPGGKRKLVYQSAGIGRNQHGVMVGIGPASIQQLDLDNGSLETIAADDSYDFLAPRKDAQGNLFFIRRPYEQLAQRRYPLTKLLADVLFFPFRLARALFDFLNVFSMVFSKKPLTTAGGPKVEGPDEKTLFLRGRIIDAEDALKKNRVADEPPSLVPRTWQLVRKDKNGADKILAEGVLSFDLSARGFILFSTGTCVFKIEPDGTQKERLFEDNVIDTVVSLD